jgi:hypothetical protein
VEQPSAALEPEGWGRQRPSRLQTFGDAQSSADAHRVLQAPLPGVAFVPSSHSYGLQSCAVPFAPTDV